MLRDPYVFTEISNVCISWIYCINTTVTTKVAKKKNISGKCASIISSRADFGGKTFLFAEAASLRAQGPKVVL